MERERVITIISGTRAVKMTLRKTEGVRFNHKNRIRDEGHEGDDDGKPN